MLTHAEAIVCWVTRTRFFSKIPAPKRERERERERDDHLGEREWNKLKYSDLQHKGSFGFVQNAEKIVQVACCFFFSRRHPMRKIKPPYILPERTPTWSLSHFYSLYIKLCVILRWPTLPSLLSILKDFPVRQYAQAACETEGTSIILCVCYFLEHSSDPSMKSPYELVKTLLVLMTDVISEGSGEHVCLHNLVRVSLTNKVLSGWRL